jgi:hypothetical protein
MTEKNLYERLAGVFASAALVDHEKQEVLAAFAAHKKEVIAGYMAAVESKPVMAIWS